MKRSSIFILLIATFGPVIASPRACSAEGVPIKIGATLSLTGKLAFSGSATQQALLLAVEDVNRNGGVNGRPLQLLVEDNGGDPRSAVSGATKLLEFDKVDLIFSSFSHITNAIQDVVRRSRKPMIYAASISNVAKENRLAFRDWGDADSQGESLAAAVAAEGLNRVAVLSETSEGCLSVLNRFKAVAAERSIAIGAEESYSPGEVDFKPLLLRISQKKVAAIVTCTLRDTALLMPQLKNMGMINTPTFQLFAPFLPVADTPEMRSLYEENHAQVVWLGYIESELTARQRELFERLKGRFDLLPRFESTLAYDDLLLASQALRPCTSEREIDLECFRSNMLDRNFDGVSGPLRFNQFGLSSRPDLLMRVNHGVWTRVR